MCCRLGRGGVRAAGHERTAIVFAAAGPQCGRDRSARPQVVDRLVQSGVKLSDVAGSSLQKITSDVRETADLIGEIAVAMQQQNSGSQEVIFWR